MTSRAWSRALEPSLKRLGAIVLGSLVLALTSGGCAPSDEEVQREFESEVQRVNVCESSSECVALSPGCPLGCWVAVPEKERDHLERKARELIDDYESGGASCDYECTEAPAVVCRDGKCATE